MTFDPHTALTEVGRSSAAVDTMTSVSFYDCLLEGFLTRLRNLIHREGSAFNDERIASYPNGVFPLPPLELVKWLIMDEQTKMTMRMKKTTRTSHRRHRSPETFRWEVALHIAVLR